MAANVTPQIGNTQSNLPTITRLFAEDYKDAPDWFKSKFVSTMNLFLQPVYGILNQGVNVTSNTTEEIYIFSFTCNSATASNNTISFQPRKFIGKPSGVIVAQCYDTTTSVPTAIGNPVTIDWYFNAGFVIILAIYGLTSGHIYSITLRIF